MVEPTTADETVRDDTLSQARALLSTLRERAAAEAPGLVDDLAELDAMLDGSKAEIMRGALEDNAAFVSVMAHELRIPMTSIRGYIDMMAKGHTGPLTDMQKQFAEVIQSNTLRMQRLVEDVNTFTKLRAGLLKLDSGMDMYKNLIMGVEKETRALAEEKDHTVNYETADGLPILQLDAVRLKDALARLVENALLYTPPGSGQITVSAVKENGNILMTIQDNGVGMTEEDMEKLEKPFERGDDDLVRTHKGHGLGFVIAKGLITLMGGAVDVESEPGTGTTVRITIPGLS